MNTTYLWVNIGTLIIPLIFTFHRQLRFDHYWKSAAIAILLPAPFFILWDVLFTTWGVWGFNARYLLPLHIGPLPLEEYLFFITIPYACLFTYHCLQKLIPFQGVPRLTQIISITLFLFLLGTGLFFINHIYTSTTFLLLAGFLTWHQFIHRSPYLSMFYLTFLFLLLPFFIVNGILTGTGLVEEVVWYNEQAMIGLRMGTIPVEDTFFGMLLILSNVTIFEKSKKFL